ncbi:MAG: hypothetical protein ACI8YQ_004989 [Polaribacter sp.]|jgi:hypothetical protein
MEEATGLRFHEIFPQIKNGISVLELIIISPDFIFQKKQNFLQPKPKGFVRPFTTNYNLTHLNLLTSTIDRC